MYHMVMVSPLEPERRPPFFTAKKYAIVVICVLTLAIWLFIHPTELILVVLDMHWRYTRRYRDFLNIFLNLIFIAVSAVHSTTGLLGAFTESYFYARVHLDFCIALEVLWLLSVHCSLANVLPLVGNTVWMLLALLYVQELKGLQREKCVEDLQYFFL